MQNGSTNQVELSRAEVVATAVPLAPSSEQLRIVAKIDSLSAKSARARGRLDHVAKLVARYKGAVLDAAYSGHLTRTWRASHPDLRAARLGERRIDGRLGELGRLPSTWTWMPFSNVAAITGGLTKNAKRASLAQRVPYLRVANVYANELRLDNVAEIGCTDRELIKTKLESGDLLIVEGNGSVDQIGRVALWNDEIADCSHQNHLIRARPSSETAPQFLLFWLLSPVGRGAIERVASSSSGLHTLSITKVEGLPVPVCPVDEQTEIVRRIEIAFAWIDRLASEAQSARKLIDRLDQVILSKAFRGELVPQDPNDEPASVLLKRNQRVNSGPKRARLRKSAT